jgi:hypothetical protein
VDCYQGGPLPRYTLRTAQIAYYSPGIFSQSDFQDTTLQIFSRATLIFAIAVILVIISFLKIKLRIISILLFILSALVIFSSGIVVRNRDYYMSRMANPGKITFLKELLIGAFFIFVTAIFLFINSFKKPSKKISA